MAPGWQGEMRLLSLRRLTVLLAPCFVLTACNSAGLEGTPQPGSAIAPEFVEWIADRELAGDFGDPLISARREGGILRQTFLNAELAFDTEAAADSRVSLSPLGLTLGLAEPPVSQPPDPAARYFARTGHTVYTGFLEAYGRLGGEGVVGAPISEVRFEEGMIYQYFANLGLYREQGAPPSEVELIAFGLASLPGVVRPAQEGAFLPPGLRDRPFAAFLDRYGGEAFFGRALSDPYLTQDGSLEQVYERAVLWAPLGAADSTAHLRPLGLALGAAEPPAELSSEGGAEYVPASGHSIHPAFTATYERIDGEQTLGLPLDEGHLDGEVLRQRFENGILEVHDQLPAALAVQLAPLGQTYTPPVLPEGEDATPTPASAPTAPAVGPVVRTWVEAPMLDPESEQRIHIEVLQSGGAPWAGVVPLVRVAAPEGAVYPAAPATDADGRCSFSLLLHGLQPGEIVTYEVVVTGEHGTAYAVGQFAARLAPTNP